MVKRYKVEDPKVPHDYIEVPDDMPPEQVERIIQRQYHGVESHVSQGQEQGWDDWAQDKAEAAVDAINPWSTPDVRPGSEEEAEETAERLSEGPQQHPSADQIRNEGLIYDGDGHLHPEAGRPEDYEKQLQNLEKQAQGLQQGGGQDTAPQIEVDFGGADRGATDQRATTQRDTPVGTAEIDPGTQGYNPPATPEEDEGPFSPAEAVAHGARETGASLIDLARAISMPGPDYDKAFSAEEAERRGADQEVIEKIKAAKGTAPEPDMLANELEKARKFISPNGEFKGGEQYSPKWWGLQILRAAPQYMTQIAATAAGGPYAGMAMIGGQIYGQTYNELRKKGVGKTKAMESAMANAALQSTLEQYGINKLMRNPMTKKAGQRIAKFIADSGREGFTEALQQAPDTITKMAGESDSWDEFSQKFVNTDWSQEAEKAGTAAGVGAALGGAGSVGTQTAQETQRRTPPAMPQEGESRELTREEVQARIKEALGQKAQVDREMQAEAEQEMREQNAQENQNRQPTERQQEAPDPIAGIDGAPGTTDPQLLQEDADIDLGQVDESDIKKVPFDQFRSWPETLPKPSRSLWPALLDFTREVGGEMGRQKTMKKNLLGLFDPKDRSINVQDVTETLTLAHEAGHMLDFRMHGDTFPSSLKKRFPDAPVSDTELRREAATVSQRQRPTAWQDPRMLGYLKKHQELMADFFSSYVHDPEGTREMAPNLTSEVERHLSENVPQTKDYVDALVDRARESDHGMASIEAVQMMGANRPISPTAQMVQDMQRDGYQEAAKNLLLENERQRRAEAIRTDRQADEIDKLVPDQTAQMDIVAAIERTDNPWTGKELQEIDREIDQDPAKRKVLERYRAYMEQSRQRANKYVADATGDDYFGYVKDYVMHMYDMNKRQAQDFAGKWTRQSPQAKPRTFPTLKDAVEAGYKPREMGLSDMLRKWNDMNQKVAATQALLKSLPKLQNREGAPIIAKPSEQPDWPRLEHHALTRTYGQPLYDKSGKKIGVKLKEGAVAVDPEVAPLLKSFFGEPFTGNVPKKIEGVNAAMKAFQLTILSGFHHQAEFFSAIGGLRGNMLGFYGKKAQALGGKRLLGLGPHVKNPWSAGKMLRNTPEVVNDFVKHGGNIGRIKAEGINIVEKKLRDVEAKLQTFVGNGNPMWWVPYAGTQSARKLYTGWQNILWDGVDRAKLATYYKIVTDGSMYTDGRTITDVKRIAAQYVNNNYGGQEFTNTIFRDPRTNWIARNGLMSLDWTWSQIKNATWWAAGVESPGRLKKSQRTEASRARAKMMRKLGRRHWASFMLGVGAFTVAGNLAMVGRFPWENERGHRIDIDWTPLWRSLPWNSDWKDRGDTARRYIGLGKAGREIMKWIRTPIAELGNKMGPLPRLFTEQLMGHGLGSTFPMPWTRENLSDWEYWMARGKHVAKQFKPFSLSGNTAFLSFPSSKGMTAYKATKSFTKLYRSTYMDAAGAANLPKLDKALAKDPSRIEQEIWDAALANGVNAKKAREAALAKAKKECYDRFFRAVKDQNLEAAEKWAKGLEKLGVNLESLQKSAEARAEWQIAPVEYGQTPSGQRGGFYR